MPGLGVAEAEGHCVLSLFQGMSVQIGNQGRGSQSAIPSGSEGGYSER